MKNLQGISKIAGRVVLALSLMAVTVGCGETPAETLKRLTDMIAANQRAEVLQEINELLIENNRELSTPLNEESTPRVLKRSLDGSVAAWTQADEFYFYTSDSPESVNFDDAELRDFSLSYTGKFAVVLAETEQGCQPYVVSLARESILDRKLPTVSCYEVPVVTDLGRYFFYPDKGGLKCVDLQPEAGPPEDPALGLPQNLPSKNFPPKYKKITNMFSLEQINQRGLLIFFGTAGAYNLYYYSGSGSSVTIIKPPGSDQFARPRVYSVFEGDTINASADDKAGAESESHPTPEKPNNAYGLDTAQGFVYSGGAGKRKLHGVRFDDPPRVQTGFTAAATQHMVFVRDRREFLILHRDHMSYWDPIRNRKSDLPLVARGFVLYSGGLVYIDLLNRVYLRKKPFSPFEIDLMRLRKQASPESE